MDDYPHRMARPYRDGNELATHPAPRREGLDAGAVIVDGVFHPASVEPLPLALSPGWEYRIRQFDPDEVHDPSRPPGWTIEKRRAQDASGSP